jgi:hypothetical protein
MMRAGSESDLFTPWEMENHPFNAEMRRQLGSCWDAGAIVGEIEGNAVLFTTQAQAGSSGSASASSQPPTRSHRIWRERCR